MKNTIAIPIVFLLFLISCNEDKRHFDYLITDVNIVDVENGVILPSRYVGISNERVSGIFTQSVAVDDSTIFLDGKGKFLIPGLWDMHTHFYWNSKYTSPLLIANGVVGVREMWGQIDSVNVLRARAKAGELIPDIYSSGDIIDGSPAYWKDSKAISTTTEAVQIVQEQIASGVDFIKVYSLLTPEIYFAISEECNKQNIPFSGHIPEKVTLSEAIIAGQSSAEHMFGILEACSNNADTLQEIRGNNRKFFFSEDYNHTLINFYDKYKVDSIIKIIANSDLWICPTLTEIKGFGVIASDSAVVNDSRLKYIDQSIKQYWEPQPELEGHAKSYKNFASIVLPLVGKMQNGGVKLLAGTDFPNPYCLPGFGLHDELELMVSGGLTPAEALRTASINPAIFMKKEKDFGSIENGKVASFILLGANPLTDIRNTTKIEMVFLRGILINQHKLETMLDSQRNSKDF